MRITCITVDCEDAERVGRFWADALGYELRSGEEGWTVAYPPAGGLYIEFQPVPEKKTAKNRAHLNFESDDVAAEIERLEILGAYLAWEEEFPSGLHYRNVIMRDPEGNEFCVGGPTPSAV